jgi:hypothetical protein
MTGAGNFDIGADAAIKGGQTRRVSCGPVWVNGPAIPPQAREQADRYQRVRTDQNPRHKWDPP